MFGNSVAGLGADKIIVGARYDDAGAYDDDAGGVYLYDTNGALLVTITDPAPEEGDYFGRSVASLGADKIIVGADQDNAGAYAAGSVYLYDMSGVLLLTITNPAPNSSDYFGFSVASLDSDKIIVGAYQDDAGAANAGSAYLFDTNGILLATIANPAPTKNDYFGYSVAGLGSDKIIVGAYQDDAGAADAGSAYLFDTNGILLANIANPLPAATDCFGPSVAGLGSDKILVGAVLDDAGAANAGSVYLFEPDAGGAFVRNTAALTASDPADTIPANNTGTVAFAVGMEADLAIAKSGASAQLPLLATNTYTITVTNRGPATATALRIADLLPGDLQFVSATPDAGWYETASHLWNINRLGAGDSASLTLQARVQESWPLAVTITNPAPASQDAFGCSVASVGSDKFIVGAFQDDAGSNNAGSAYLYDTSGALLATITNPAPAAGDYFGNSVAGLGTDKIIVGAYSDDAGTNNAGSAYLYDTSGVLLTTITNPAPAANDYFGYSVAGLGTDKILVGANQDDAGAVNAGSVYLYNTNGVLLVTITNPAPAANDYFGCSVAGLGSDKIIVGAYGNSNGAIAAGSVYLFDANGVLLTTITNPAPAASDYFGISVAGLGSDKIIVGANQDDAVATDGGSAYLFDTNGVLLATITNPAPMVQAFFGYSVAGVRSDRIIVGAPRDSSSGAIYAGSAYLFDTNGVFLPTIAKPALPEQALFGWSVAGVGSNKVIVGAAYNSVGTTYDGSAYLYNCRTPPYSVTNRVTPLTYAQALTNEANASASASLLVGEGGGTTYDLTIESPYGSTVPAVGVHEVNEGQEVTVQAISPDTRGTTQYVCTGWTATANLSPASGSGTQAVVTVNGDGTLTWLWRTDFWLDPSAGPNGSVDRVGGWFTNNEPVSVEALPDACYHFTNWTGDVEAGSEQDNPLNLVMDGPRAVKAYFTAITTTNGTPLWWLAQYGITNNLEEAVFDDPDHDGIPTGDEYIANTDPTNAMSFLQTAAYGLIYGTNCYDVVTTNSEPPYEVVTNVICDVIGQVMGWPCATDRVYDVQHAMALPPGIWAPMPGMTNLVPTSGMLVLTNTITGDPIQFYRLRARLP